MSFKVFIPQETIDRWVGADQVDLANDVLTFRGSMVSLLMVPGYFFVSVSGDAGDRHGLLGRVRTSAAVKVMGAEIYMDSVLLGETAYDVEAGFVGKPVDRACTRATLAAAIDRAEG